MPPVVAAVGAIAIGVSGVAATVLTAVGVSAAVAGAISGAILMAGISGLASAALKVVGLGPRPPKASPASTERLKAGLDPRSFRKIVFGQTAANLDMHYQEFTGTSQEYLNSIITLASHELHSIDEIWFDEKKAWDSSGVIHPDFTGYLAVQKREVGTTANALTITGSSSWVSSASRLVGCSYIWLRYKLTGNDKKAESPFAQNVTSRITVRVRGAKLYDPRRDSTMGGSGSQRVSDQTTWAWVDDNTGRNPALQLLWYLLGWRIQNPSTGGWKLAVGLGLPVERLDIPSFIAAANLCDEAVTKASGGTEPRYRSDGVFSEGDDPLEVIDNLRATMNGVLRDAGGKLKLDILHNDLGSPVCDLSDGDVIGEFTWTQTPPIDETFNVVRGRYVDPTDAGLYQLVDYPDVSIPSPDGIERASSFDMPMVQSPSQAQRLAKTYLQRAQYPGTFMAEFLASAWRCEVGSVVRLTFPALGFVNKLFRVVEHSINVDGRCPMVLREENASIYAWDADESPAVSAATPISYNPLNDPILQGISDIAAAPTAIVYIYQRASSAPSLPTADVTYTFADHTISGLTGGWSATIPAGANPLYVAAATASYNGGTDIITPAEWSSPVVLAQDGSPGSPGATGTNGLNTATVTLYARTATNSAPTVTRAGSATYTFATGAITGQPSGWTTGVPASGGGFLWVIRATAAATTSTDTIANTEWASPVLMVQNGSDGAPGSNGATNAIVYIYRRSATTPALPTATATYTFATGALTGLNNSWTATIPAGSDPLYVAAATASSTGSTDTIAASEWSSPVILAQDGAPGSPGAPGASGLNSATVTLHQRTLTSSAPSVTTTGSATYTFATGAITGQPSGWASAVPSSGGGYLWVIRATAASTSATDTIANTEWSAPVLLAQDGAPGAAGAAGAAATSAYLTNEVAQVFAYADGTVVSYGPATGEFKVFAGSADISSNFTLSVVSNPQTLTVSFTGRVYTVTGGFDAGEDTATVTIRATGSGSYAGVTFDKVFALAKAKGGYEIVSTLPITNLFEGRIVFLKTDDKLYRYTGSAWTKAVDGADIQANSILTNSIGAGQITAAQLASTELITLSAQIGTAVITGAKIGNLEVNTLKIANNAVNAVVTSYGGAGTVSDTLDVDFGSVSLSTIGGIVRIDISFDSYRSSGSTSVNLTAQIVRVVGTTETVIEQRKGASSASFPPTSFFITDSPGAGSVSYKARFSVDGGSGSFAVSSVAFAATEIKR